MKTEINNNDCCVNNRTDERSGFMQGFIFGILPHSFCILFLVLSVLGSVFATSFLRPLLLIPHLFTFLILISIFSATVSVVYYLKTTKKLSFVGVKNNWRYVSTVYGSTILVNLLFFYFIMPFAANLHAAGLSEEKMAGSLSEVGRLKDLYISVDIPCSGHSSLIIDEINKIRGVNKISFNMPNIFAISFDSSEVSVDDILSLEVFDTYKAKII